MTKELTDNQKKIIAFYAKKAQLRVEEITKRVKDWVCTISELSQGILWEKLQERFLKKSF